VQTSSGFNNSRSSVLCYATKSSCLKSSYLKDSLGSNVAAPTGYYQNHNNDLGFVIDGDFPTTGTSFES
jgi:hypothetical protein